MKTTLFAFLLVGCVLPALAASPEESPKTQIVDLDKLEIEGRVPSPSTLFIRERTTGSCYELFPLRRELPDSWLMPVDKAKFDRETWDLAGSGGR